MYCRACGQNIPDDSVYCPECGEFAGGPVASRPPPPPTGQWPAPHLGAGAGTARVAVPNYLLQSILVTVLCCLPIGVVAIVQAAQANSKNAAGDYEGAIKAANSAKTWCWVALGSGLVVGIGYFLVLLSSAQEF